MNHSCDTATPTLIYSQVVPPGDTWAMTFATYLSYKQELADPPPCRDGNQGTEGKHIELSLCLFCVKHITRTACKSPPDLLI